MLRSTLSTQSSPIYCVSWSPDSQHVLFSTGTNLTIKPLAPNSKPIVWKGRFILLGTNLTIKPLAPNSKPIVWKGRFILQEQT